MSESKIIPGQASPVTVLIGNPNGQKWVGKFIAPPGKDAVLPDNIATTDNLDQMVSGTDYTMLPSDLRGYSLFLNASGEIIATFQDHSGKKTVQHLLTQEGPLTTSRGNVIPEITTQSGGNNHRLMQFFDIQNAVDGLKVPFPQQFTDDNVLIFLTPVSAQINGKWSMPYCGYWGANKANFVLTRYFSDSAMNATPGLVKCLAIGSI